MKLDIVGASHLVNRNVRGVRELSVGPRVPEERAGGRSHQSREFGIEWQAVERLGVYRRTVSDNGSGMTREELRRLLLHAWRRREGVSAAFTTISALVRKIASLPWNPEGVRCDLLQGLAGASMIVHPNSTTTARNMSCANSAVE